MEPILEVKALTMNFGGLRALDSIDLEVHKDQIVALIGPNGAGKTTFFNCITGIYKPTKGEMTISPQGKVTDVKILRGIPLLDQAAVSAVRQWVYTPTLLNGVPVPVIMITANEGARHREYAEMLGVSDYIPKPFTMDRLLNSVSNLLTIK